MIRFFCVGKFELWKGAEKGAEKGAKKGAKTKKAQEIEERTENILKIITIEPDITQTEIIDRLGISRKQVQDAIKLLENQNKIERVGSNRKGYWKVLQWK